MSTQGAWLSELETHRPQPLYPLSSLPPTFTLLCLSGLHPPNCIVVKALTRRLGKDRVMGKSGVPAELRKRDQENAKSQDNVRWGQMLYKMYPEQQTENNWVLQMRRSRKSPWRWGHLQGRPRPGYKP